MKKAYEKEAEEMLWQRWLVDYSMMDKKTFKSFEEYKKQIFKKSVEVKDTRSDEELLKEAMEIEELARKRGELSGNI